MWQEFNIIVCVCMCAHVHHENFAVRKIKIKWDSIYELFSLHGARRVLKRV